MAEQEAITGRRGDTGAPSGGRRELDRAPLEAFPPRLVAEWLVTR